MHCHRTSFRQSGVTIVELMVAMTLALVITAGVIAIYVQGGRSHTQDDRYARMQEHGRFAMQQMVGDLKMSDFWGEMLDPGGIVTPLGAGEDCDIDLFNATSAIQYNNNSSATTSSHFDETADGCPALTGTVRAGTDLLAIKRVGGQPLTAGQSNNVVYLRTNGVVGNLINDAAATPLPAGFRDWLYLPRVYYIRFGAGDAVPMLCRLDLNNTAFAAVAADGCLAEGIEGFHIEWGVDTDLDGVANQYIASPTAAQLEDAVSARLYILVRSATGDVAYTNDKTYNLGDIAVGPFNDNFYRRVYSTTVTLRNPANLIQFE